MSINFNGVAFASDRQIDKIVRVDEGSFTAGTDTTTVGGFLERYDISHGYTRPVFTDLLWSADNVTWIDGGAGQAANSFNSAISYSDSSQIHILTTQTSGTVYYKLISFWIPDYDDTNPFVEPYAAKNNTILFDSRLNYQKIQQSGDIEFNGAGTETVTNNEILVDKPNYRVFFEAFPDEVWPANFGGVRNPFLYDFTNQAELNTSTSSTTLSMTLTLPGGAADQTRKVWYRLYEDAG